MRSGQSLGGGPDGRPMSGKVVVALIALGVALVALISIALAVFTADPRLALRPPDASPDGAAPCLPASPTGPYATLLINPDVPSPRCLRASPEQQLRLVNGREEPIRVRLDPVIDVDLAPGEEVVIERRLGTYLAPGVHRLEIAMPQLRWTVPLLLQR